MTAETLCHLTALAKLTIKIELSLSEYCMLMPVIIRIITTIAFTTCHNLTQTGYRYIFSRFNFIS